MNRFGTISILRPNCLILWLNSSLRTHLQTDAQILCKYRRTIRWKPILRQ